jgi:urease accessory protein
MSRTQITRILAGAAGALVAQAALAHPGHGGETLFASGFMHPLGGADHLLAMLAVGIWAAQSGKQAIWKVPLAFVLAMLAGTLLGTSGFALPMVEPVIGVSVLALGLLIAMAVRMRTAAGMATAAVFALFHGYAHGAEMTGGSVWPYLAGLLLATALLHASGALATSAARSEFAMRAVRIGGGAIAFAGAWMLAGF